MEKKKKNNVVKGPWATAGMAGDGSPTGESTFAITKEMWNELVMNYRETVTSASNLCSGVMSALNRVEIGRMEREHALDHIKVLCRVAHCDVAGHGTTGRVLVPIA